MFLLANIYKRFCGRWRHHGCCNQNKPSRTITYLWIHVLMSLWSECAIFCKYESVPWNLSITHVLICTSSAGCVPRLIQYKRLQVVKRFLLMTSSLRYGTTFNKYFYIPEFPHPLEDAYVPVCILSCYLFPFVLISLFYQLFNCRLLPWLLEKFLNVIVHGPTIIFASKYAWQSKSSFN